MTLTVQTITDPRVAALASQAADTLEATHGKATRDDSHSYLGGVKITDTGSASHAVYQDIERLRALADQASGGRARPYFMVAKALQMIDVEIKQ